jgi:hypothetical protein
MASKIIAKLACWGQDQMPKSDLNFYLQWLKDQLTAAVSDYQKFGVKISNIYRQFHLILLYVWIMLEFRGREKKGLIPNSFKS